MKHGERRRAAILTAGIVLMRERRAVTARAVGKACGISHAAVLYHYRSSDALRDAVAAEAIRTHDRDIVPVLIALKHPAAASLSDSERRRFRLDIP